jgi:hypothetical protein
MDRRKGMTTSEERAQQLIDALISSGWCDEGGFEEMIVERVTIALNAHAKEAAASGVKEFYSEFYPLSDYEGYTVRTMAMNYVRNNGGDSSDMTSGFN